MAKRIYILKYNENDWDQSIGFHPDFKQIVKFRNFSGAGYIGSDGKLVSNPPPLPNGISLFNLKDNWVMAVVSTDDRKPRAWEWFDNNGHEVPYQGANTIVSVSDSQKLDTIIQQTGLTVADKGTKYGDAVVAIIKTYNKRAGETNFSLNNTVKFYDSVKDV